MMCSPGDTPPPAGHRKSPKWLPFLISSRVSLGVSAWHDPKRSGPFDFTMLNRGSPIPLSVSLTSMIDTAPKSIEPIEEKKTFELNTRRHVKYDKSIPELAALYDATERTVKRWIHAGKVLGDLAPLDRPESMGAWWIRVFRYRMPAKLLALAAAAKPAPVLPSAPTASLPPATAAQILMSANEFVSIAQTRLRTALNDENDFQIKLRKTDLNVALDTLAKARANFEADKRGESTILTRADIAACAQEFCESLSTTFGDLTRRFVTNCITEAAKSPCSAREFVRRRLAIGRAAPFVAAAIEKLTIGVVNEFRISYPEEVTRRARQFVADMQEKIRDEEELDRQRTKSELRDTNVSSEERPAPDIPIQTDTNVSSSEPETT